MPNTEEKPAVYSETVIGASLGIVCGSYATATGTVQASMLRAGLVETALLPQATSRQTIPGPTGAVGAETKFHTAATKLHVGATL